MIKDTTMKRQKRRTSPKAVDTYVRVYQWRKRLGIPTQTAANALGMETRTYLQREANPDMFHVYEILALCTLFDCEITDLIRPKYLN